MTNLLKTTDRLTVPAAPNYTQRIKDLARIHTLKKQAMWAEDTYRSKLQMITGCESAKDCTAAQRQALINVLSRAAATAQTNLTPAQLKAFSLWKKLAAQEKISNGSAGALNKYCHTHLGVSNLRWLSGEQTAALIEQLKNFLKRD